MNGDLTRSGGRGRRPRAAPLLQALGWAILAPFSLWCCGAILLGGNGPDGIGGTRWGLPLLFAASVVAGPWRLGSRRRMGFVALLGVAVLGWFGTIRPSNDRDWSPDQRRLAWVEIDETLVTIHNVRDFRYRSTTDWDARWYEAAYDTRELEGVDFFTIHFSD